MGFLSLGNLSQPRLPPCLGSADSFFAWHLSKRDFE
jgi:hypothetical protein